ncbi:hypothetical protein J437_LFUL016212, partial [Ladona fulva]
MSATHPFTGNHFSNPKLFLKDLVQEELDNLLGAPGHEKRLVTLEDAIHLPYTEAAIAEAQRIRPVVPLGIPHGALKDTSLGGYRIPKGTMLIALQWVLHNGEVPWGKDAEKIFDPTRFIDSDGNFSSRQKEHFMPFQTGNSYFSFIFIRYTFSYRIEDSYLFSKLIYYSNFK